MRLRAVAYEIPFRRPIPTAHGTLSIRRGWVVLAETPDGRVGCGEVAPLPEWGTEAFGEAEKALAELAARLSHDLPPNAPRLDDWLDAAGLPRQSLPATRAGIELACLDLQARARNQSLAAYLTEHLNDAPRPLEQVPINALLSAGTPEELAREARERVREGYATLKLKLGVEGIAEDVARVKAVREAVGPAVRLRGDANGAWDLPRAIAALEALRPFDLEYLEQPVAEARDLAALQARAILPVAADESALDARAIRTLISERSVDWLILKPLALGGLLYTADLAQEARRTGIGVTLTSVLDRGIGTAGTLHLAAALGLEAACGLSNTHLAPEHFLGSASDAGCLALAPLGHGIRLDEAVLSREAQP